jgi:hypothetical protein
VIQASVPGKGDGSNGSTVAFNPVTENQRAALALSNGVLYVGWASFCDTRPYHGWMMSYDASTLAQLGVFNSSPDGNMAGIWMSGAGPGFDDAGNLYFSTGNGTFDGKSEFGESMVKVQAKTLRPLDFFVFSNFNTLNDFDLDFLTKSSRFLGNFLALPQVAIGVTDWSKKTASAASLSSSAIARINSEKRSSAASGSLGSAAT